MLLLIYIIVPTHKIIIFCFLSRLETCLTPDSACRLLAPCYQSKCTQKYVYERMLAYDPCDPYKGLFIDVFKFPSACSCHIPQPHV